MPCAGRAACSAAALIAAGNTRATPRPHPTIAGNATAIVSTATSAKSDAATSRPESRIVFTRDSRDSSHVPPKRPIIMAKENAA